MRPMIVILIAVFVAGSWISGTAAARQTPGQQQEGVRAPVPDGPSKYTEVDHAHNRGCPDGEAGITGVACGFHASSCGATLVRIWESTTLAVQLLKPFKHVDLLSGIAMRPPCPPPQAGENETRNRQN